MNGSRLIAAALTLCAAFSTASAHHSFAIFDHERSYRLAGVIEDVQWTNPHGYLELRVTDGPDGIEHFTLELTSINMLRRANWSSRDVRAGDEVTVVTAPLLSGEPAGLLLEIALPDGRVLVPPVPAIDSFERDPR